MRVMALFSTSFFAKYLCVVEDGPGQGHLCHIDTFLVSFCLLFSSSKKGSVTVTFFWASLGGSVGCAVRLETRRSRVQPPPRSATFFRGD